MIKNILIFFDKLEDKIRGRLSHAPLMYALVGGVGVILFWRGIWHMADDISMSSTLSAIIGAIILLMTGVFVSAFVGNRLILTGLRGEKKLAEKAGSEIRTEESQIEDLQKSMSKIEKELETIEQEIKKD
jgi:hypothetical protein